MKVIAPILARLRTRPVAVFLLVYQAVFLNVVLPGHTRGAVTLDGRHTADWCCCCGGGAEARPAPDRKGPSAPSQRDRDHCAFCHFAARLVPPVVPDVRLAPPGLLVVLTTPRPAAIAPAARIVTYYGRGPPTPA